MKNITLLTFFEVLLSKIKCCFLSKNMVSTLGFRMPNLLNFSTGFQNKTLTKRFALCGGIIDFF